MGRTLFFSGDKMIFAGSIIYISPEKQDDIKAWLGVFDNIEIYETSADGRQLVVAIEAEDDRALEAFCAEIKGYDGILEVAHHIFNFEDDVEEILTGNKVPSLEGFFKSARKRDLNG